MLYTNDPLLNPQQDYTPPPQPRVIINLDKKVIKLYKLQYDPQEIAQELDVDIEEVNSIILDYNKNL